MEKVHTPPDETAELPGPLYPDRCLECPELLCECYGCVRHNKCVDCVAASLRQKEAAAALKAKVRKQAA